jgi:hypothetical protein
MAVLRHVREWVMINRDAESYISVWHVLQMAILTIAQLDGHSGTTVRDFSAELQTQLCGAAAQNQAFNRIKFFPSMGRQFEYPVSLSKSKRNAAPRETSSD